MNTKNFDRLSLTFTPSEKYKKISHEKLYKLSLENYKNSKNGFSCKYLKKYKSRYKHNYKLTFYISKKHNFTLSISVLPIDYHIDKNSRKGKKQNYIRIDFNPNIAEKYGIKLIYKFLSSIFSKKEVKKIHTESKVTRVDMCVDTFSKIGVIYPYLPQVKYYNSIKCKNGELASIILGSGKSKYRITFYDKNKEIEFRGKTKSHENHFRLEIRVRNLQCNLKELNPSKIKDKLLKLIFFSPTLLREKKIKQLFKINTKEIGINRSLLELECNERRKYIRVLKKNHVINNVFDIKGINMENFMEPLKPFMTLE